MATTLGAYFDESERTLAGEPIAVGGFVFRPAAYREFERKWRRMLRTAPGGPIPFMHMTDLYAGHGHFKRPVKDRVRLLHAACGLIERHAMAGVATIIDQQQFQAVAPKNWPNVLGSIYSGSCQMCLQITGYWIKHHNVNLTIHYVFENGQAFENEADSILKGMGHNEVHRALSRYQGHTFVDKRAAAGLQAADIYVWLATKYAADSPTSRAAMPFLEPLLSICRDKDRFTFNHFTGDVLNRLVQEQVNGFMTKYRQGEVQEIDTGPHARLFRSQPRGKFRRGD
ncbi:MAG: DUF3800 domain-containing protein [Vicinamibacterales bacterium]